MTNRNGRQMLKVELPLKGTNGIAKLHARKTVGCAAVPACRLISRPSYDMYSIQIARILATLVGNAKQQERSRQDSIMVSGVPNEVQCQS